MTRNGHATIILSMTKYGCSDKKKAKSGLSPINLGPKIELTLMKIL